MTEENTNGAATGNQAGDRAYNLQRLYLKDVSFESPNSPEVFLKDWKPNVELNMTTSNRKIDEDDALYEVILSLSIQAKHEDKTAFLIELHQAGIFQAKGFEGEELNVILSVHCPQNLYPFAREAVASLAMKGGFPQILLHPINFEGIYRQKMAEQQAAAKS